MTRVCVRCGWLVFGRSHCSRCGGPAVVTYVAERAVGARSLLDLLHTPPAERVAAFQAARRRHLDARIGTR